MEKVVSVFGLGAVLSQNQDQSKREKEKAVKH